MLWFLQGIGYNGLPSDPFWQYDFDDTYFDSDNETWTLVDVVMTWIVVSVVMTWTSVTVMMT